MLTEPLAEEFKYEETVFEAVSVDESGPNYNSLRLYLNEIGYIPSYLLKMKGLLAAGLNYGATFRRLGPG